MFCSRYNGRITPSDEMQVCFRNSNSPKIMKNRRNITQGIGSFQKTNRLKKCVEHITLIMPIQYSNTKCFFCEQKQDLDGRCPCVNKDAW